MSCSFMVAVVKSMRNKRERSEREWEREEREEKDQKQRENREEKEIRKRDQKQREKIERGERDQKQRERERIERGERDQRDRDERLLQGLIFRYRSYLLYENSQILKEGNSTFTANQGAQVNRVHKPGATSESMVLLFWSIAPHCRIRMHPLIYKALYFKFSLLKFKK